MHSNHWAGSVERPKLLLVSPFEIGHAHLRELFAESDAEIYGVFDVEEALSLARRSNLAAIICEHEFDARNSWKQLFHGLESLEVPPPLVVASRLAHGELWSEVINLGGCDVLMKPFDRNAAHHVLGRACGVRIANFVGGNGQITKGAWA